MKREGKFSILNSQFSIRRWQHRRRSGFTLIEMLVVIVIIVILMGVVFKLSKGAMDKATYAKEAKRLAILRTLIEEFYAEYGIYPPVPEYHFKKDYMHYADCFPANEKPKYASIQPVDFTGAYPKTGDSEDLRYYPGHYSVTKDTDGDYFAFGLMSVFLDRGKYCNKAFSVAGENNKDVNRDWRGPNGEYNDKPEYVDGQLKVKVPIKDKAFVKRVAPIVAQIYDGNLNVWVDQDNGHSKGFTTYIRDSWGNPYFYISKPPHTTYLVFSAGPDGKVDWKNPGDRDAKNPNVDVKDEKDRYLNRDNIYGNLGDK
jgi:prepilin-type N-terminal cleavage/methylation domain-containing protein